MKREDAEALRDFVSLVLKKVFKYPEKVENVKSREIIINDNNLYYADKVI
jgi:hypothetical protein